MELGLPNLEEFGRTLVRLGQADRDVLVVTSDSRGSAKLVQFGKSLPDQIVEVGIAEQNLVGIAAGLASTGKKVFAVSPACFLTTRSLEQIKNDVAYSDNPVKVIGISAGVSYGALGSTHHSLHDFAALRCVNNIDVVAPADNFETRSVLETVLKSSRPVYIRFGKQPMPNLHAAGTKFEVGKAITLMDGGVATDITYIATGEALPVAFFAARQLTQKGISCRVISMHTIKPLDTDALLHAARHSKALLTVEEHSVYGGLGGACAEALMEAGIALPFKIVGIPDEYTVTGSQQEIFAHYGITPEGLAEKALQLL